MDMELVELKYVGKRPMLKGGRRFEPGKVYQLDYDLALNLSRQPMFELLKPLPHNAVVKIKAPKKSYKKKGDKEKVKEIVDEVEE